MPTKNSKKATIVELHIVAGGAQNLTEQKKQR